MSRKNKVGQFPKIEHILNLMRPKDNWPLSHQVENVKLFTDNARPMAIGLSKWSELKR